VHDDNAGVSAADLLNHALTNGPLSLPDAVAMLDTAPVRFRLLDGPDREIAVPRLTFTEPIAGVAT
jgi:hypothetical protein